MGCSYLVRVGPAYAFLGLGLALFFAAQGRRRVMQPLLATLTRLLVAGGLGIFALLVFQSGIDSLFILMACGLVLYGLVMVVVMRRELGVVGMPLSPAPGQEPPGPGEELAGVLSGEVAH
jgi:Na+-driven multidrug efflux pump